MSGAGSWVRSIARRLLDGLAARIALRLPPPPASSLADHEQLLRRVFSEAPVYDELEWRSRMTRLVGRVAAMGVSRTERIRDLGDVEISVSSKWGEDGIIEWLCARLPHLPRSFVEFGVENFTEANTRFLLENRGWRGLIIDGDSGHMAGVRESELYWRHDLTAVSAFVTAENINDLITSNGFAGELGILSVDIDGNDYWVLKAIDCVDPWIIICEINGVFGDKRAFTVPYRPDFERLKAHYSGQYFGCSAAAARRLCEERGYTYIGTNTNGVNAFFVRNDLAGEIGPRIESVRTWPQRHRDSRNIDGGLDHQRGLAKYELVKDLPVVDLDTGALVSIADLGSLYSDDFLRDFK